MGKDILLSPQMLRQLGKQLGYSNSIPPQFVELASTLLMGGMAKKTNSENDVESLLKDIDEDTEGQSILDQLEKGEPDLTGAGKKQGILDNLLGDKIDPLAEAFSKATGLPKDKAKQLMILLAPVLLAVVAQKVTGAKNRNGEVAKEVKKTYKNPFRNKEAIKIEQEKLKLEEQELELEKRRKVLQQKRAALNKRMAEIQKNSAPKNAQKNRPYQMPNKEDGGLLEKLLDRNGDGSFVDEATTLLKNILLK